MSVIKRIRNGTTTDNDADKVKGYFIYYLVIGIIIGSLLTALIRGF